MVISIAFVCAVITGCSQQREIPIDPVEQQIKSMFTADIRHISRIVMLQADGEVRSFSDKETINHWIDQVGELYVTLNPNPEEHSGVLFTVTCWGEEEQPIFTLTPTSINGASILVNENLVDHMYELWNH